MWSLEDASTPNYRVVAPTITIVLHLWYRIARVHLCNWLPPRRHGCPRPAPFSLRTPDGVATQTSIGSPRPKSPLWWSCKLCLEHIRACLLSGLTPFKGRGSDVFSPVLSCLKTWNLQLACFAPVPAVFWLISKMRCCCFSLMWNTVVKVIQGSARMFGRHAQNEWLPYLPVN